MRYADLSGKKPGVLLLTAASMACLVFTACAVQPIPADKNPANDVQEGDLYRNTRYGFSIIFPADWKQGGSTAASVVRRATDDRGNSVVIGVTELPVLSRIFASDIEIVANDENIIKSMSAQVEDFKFIEKGKAQISNENAVWMKYSLSYTVAEKKLPMVLVVYNLMHNGILYTLTTTDVPEARKSVDTFLFEDF